MTWCQGQHFAKELFQNLIESILHVAWLLLSAYSFLYHTSNLHSQHYYIEIFIFTGFIINFLPETKYEGGPPPSGLGSPPLHKYNILKIIFTYYSLFMIRFSVTTSNAVFYILNSNAQLHFSIIFPLKIE